MMIEDFKNYLQNIGYQKDYQRQILRHVNELLQFTSKSLQNITTSDIQGFFEYLEQRPMKQQRKRDVGALSEKTIYDFRRSIKHCYAWLEQTEQITINPISHLAFKVPDINTREPLSLFEIHSLFEAATNIKEKISLHLFYSCGLRRDEAVQLNLVDVHFSKGFVYVRKGKGSKRRVIPINQSIVKDFEQYYQDYRQHYPKQSAFMLNHRNTRMQGLSYYTLLQKIVGRTRIEHSISLHHLRHSIATHLLQNGLSLEFVRDFLGHADLRTTQIYTKVYNYQIKAMK